MDYTSFKKIIEFGNHEGSITSICFFPNGEDFLCASEDSLKLWNLHTRTSHKSYKVDGIVNGIAIEPEGKRFICGLDEGGVRIWGKDDPEATYVFGSRDAEIKGISLSKDGRNLAVIEESTIVIYAIQTLRRERQHHVSTEGLSSIAWTPQGDCYLTSTLDGYLTLWELDTAKAVWEKYENGSPIYDVAFNPETEYLISHRWGKSILRYTANGGEVSTFFGHEGDITNAFFDHLGTHLITASSGSDGDDTIRIFELSTQRMIKKLESPETTKIAVSPNGKYIAAGTEDGTIVLYGV